MCEIDHTVQTLNFSCLFKETFEQGANTFYLTHSKYKNLDFSYLVNVLLRFIDSTDNLF